MCLCVRPSVTSRCSSETAKHRIMQTALRNSPGTLVFWCRKSGQNSKQGYPNGGTKCRWGSLNAGAIAANWQLLTWNVVILAWLQVYHTEHQPYLFAAHSPWCIPLPQIDVIGGMVIVWMVRGKIIRSVLCNIVRNNCAQCNAHTWTDITVLWIGFCLTWPISLCLDSFLYVCIFCMTLYCMHV